MLVARQGGSSGPFRGNFMTPPFEGSIRILAIVRWPAAEVTQQILSPNISTGEDFHGYTTR